MDPDPIPAFPTTRRSQRQGYGQIHTLHDLENTANNNNDSHNNTSMYDAPATAVAAIHPNQTMTTSTGNYRSSSWRRFSQRVHEAIARSNQPNNQTQNIHEHTVNGGVAYGQMTTQPNANSHRTGSEMHTEPPPEPSMGYVLGNDPSIVDGPESHGKHRTQSYCTAHEVMEHTTEVNEYTMNDNTNTDVPATNDDTSHKSHTKHTTHRKRDRFQKACKRKWKKFKKSLQIKPTIAVPGDIIFVRWSDGRYLPLQVRPALNDSAQEIGNVINAMKPRTYHGFPTQIAPGCGAIPLDTLHRTGVPRNGRATHRPTIMATPEYQEYYRRRQRNQAIAGTGAGILAGALLLQMLF